MTNTTQTPTRRLPISAARTSFKVVSIEAGLNAVGELRDDGLFYVYTDDTQWVSMVWTTSEFNQPVAVDLDDHNWRGFRPETVKTVWVECLETGETLDFYPAETVGMLEYTTSGYTWLLEDYATA
jgi:hypothetical protein